MKIAIVGSGYVGLVSAACWAEKGHTIACVDVDRERVHAIAAGQAPFHEPELNALLARHAGSRLFATLDLERAVREAELTVIATGTPFDGARIDLGAVKSAAASIGRALRGHERYHTVVVKSTVVPGTTDEVVGPIVASEAGMRAGADFGLGMTPEFLSEGQAVRDCLRPDRIVLGAIDARTHAVLEELHAPFAGVPRLRTNNHTAETIKYASNALLATMISFSNEIASLCEELPEVDAVDVLRGVHLASTLTSRLEDGRTVEAGLTSFLHPGCGYGGSCLPKDVQALVAHARDRAVAMPLLEAVERVNARQPARLVELVERQCGDLHGVRVAVMGLAFKPDTDDMRASPAIAVVNSLADKGAIVTAFDPAAAAEARKVLDPHAVRVCDTIEAALDGARAVVLVTRWEDFRALPRWMRDQDPQPFFVDGRRMLEKRAYTPYAGVGWRAAEAPAHVR